MNLKLENCRGQCYDGAAVMSGKKTGVAARIKSLNGKALYTHCYGHALNLCVKDACDKVECLKDTFDASYEICKLIKKSPQRETILNDLRVESQNTDPSVHAFCVTRWTVRGNTLAAIINNHKEVMALWEQALQITKDTEMKARIIGVQEQMRQFRYFFGCFLGQKILIQTDNLSKTLQNRDLSAIEGQEIASAVVKVLKKDRCDQHFELLWNLALIKIKDKDIDEPILPRKRRRPARYEDGEEGYQPQNAKDIYKVIYFQAYDYVINAISERFDQPDYKMYATMRNILFMSMGGKNVEEQMDEVVFNARDGSQVSFRSLYNDDINIDLLIHQLQLLPIILSSCKDSSIHDIFVTVRNMSKAKRVIISEVVTLLKLLIVVPATNAESERGFSTMRRIKNYLRSTMGDNRLDNLMVLCIHKESLDQIDMVKVLNEFVAKKITRRRIFGVFSKEDLPKKTSTLVCNASTQTI